MSRRYQTTGYQWFCVVDRDCPGSEGGFDGSRADIQETMERAVA